MEAQTIDMQKKLTIVLLLFGMTLAVCGGEITNRAVRVRIGEMKNEVEVVRVRMKCDAPKCTGEMLPTCEVVCAYFKHYPHRCNACGRSATYPIIYPELRPVNGINKRTKTKVSL